MFSSRQHSDDLYLQEPSVLGQDLIDLDNFLTAADDTKKRQRKSKLGVQEEIKDDQTNTKKIKHRETERQRRQEMATLYASLRTLLPLEYIKGKRSVSDHMHEAVNYIKHMEARIKELQTQRDELKKKSASIPDIFQTQTSNHSKTHLDRVITLSPCRNGIEILVSCGIEEDKQGFPISKVLLELMNIAGLNIVSCISSKSNGRFHYRIQSDVSDPTCINLSELQQRLSNVI